MAASEEQPRFLGHCKHCKARCYRLPDGNFYSETDSTACICEIEKPKIVQAHKKNNGHAQSEYDGYSKLFKMLTGQNDEENT